MDGQPAAKLEGELLQEIARDYQRRGYWVLQHPGQRELPAFLSDFRPDLVAYGSDEDVVVEVASRSALAKSADLIPLAEAVDARPGWRFELVVVGNRDTLVVGEDAEELDRREIRSRLAAVRYLLGSGQEEAASLLAWSAAEAAMRVRARRERIALERDQPTFILKTLVSLGVVSREEYTLFQEGLRLRNLIVHGYRVPGPNWNAIDKMIGAVEELLVADTAYPAEPHPLPVD